jgi:hypothetical protein
LGISLIAIDSTHTRTPHPRICHLLECSSTTVQWNGRNQQMKRPRPAALCPRRSEHASVYLCAARDWLVSHFWQPNHGPMAGRGATGMVVGNDDGTSSLVGLQHERDTMHTKDRMFGAVLVGCDEMTGLLDQIVGALLVKTYQSSRRCCAGTISQRFSTVPTDSRILLLPSNQPLSTTLYFTATNSDGAYQKNISWMGFMSAIQQSRH